MQEESNKAIVGNLYFKSIDNGCPAIDNNKVTWKLVIK